jgi:hypothetical protein
LLLYSSHLPLGVPNGLVIQLAIKRCRDPEHNRRTTAQTREESYVKSLSAQQSEEEEDFVQETLEAALVAA